VFTDKELSVDITIQEAKELLLQLSASIDDYKSLERDSKIDAI
jgi:hypothetical protein